MNASNTKFIIETAERVGYRTETSRDEEHENDFGEEFKVLIFIPGFPDEQVFEGIMEFFRAVLEKEKRYSVFVKKYRNNVIVVN